MRHAWVDGLSDLGACREAVEWASDYESLDAAWAACERGDWMLWLLGRVSGAPESDDRKALVLCACACARTALRFVPAGETRPLAAIEMAERWGRGEPSVTLCDVRQAGRASYAYAAYAADVAAYAANAAAYAADVAASAANAVASAAAAAAADAADADADAARANALKVCADIVRQHYPAPPQIGGAR